MACPLIRAYGGFLSLTQCNLPLEADGCTARQRRLNIIWLLPNLWVLDQRFITEAERVDAEALVSPHVRALGRQPPPLPPPEQQQQHEGPGSSPTEPHFLHSPGVFTLNAKPSKTQDVGKLASSFLSLLSGQPTGGEARDRFRLTHLSSLYDQEADRHNQYARQQVRVAHRDRQA